ncbi:MAG TPA: 30S ribosomal protein S8 [bacterium]|nr:30S ribosomal protein S8 [bacterium]
MINDPIADIVSRLKNGLARRKDKVDVPASGFKERLLELMKREGFILGYSKTEDGKQGMLTVELKYKNGAPVLRGAKKISNPGARIYVDKDHIPRILQGTGVAFISTSQGLMTDREARKRKVGGEVICTLW